MKTPPLSRYRKARFLTFFIAAAFFTLVPHLAHSSFISPMRVVIDANKTTAEVVILNREDVPMVYTFGWQRRAMDINGKIVELGEDGEMEGYRPADPYLIYSPRKAIVGPGETQRIRILARRTKDMVDGEYRSHILISPKTTKKPKQTVVKHTGGSIPVSARVGIPVFLRKGKTTASVEPKRIEIGKRDGLDVLFFDLTNNSTRTLYPKTDLYCTRPGEEKPELIELSALRLFYEAVNISYTLPIPEGANLDNCTSITLKLVDPKDFEYSKTPLLETVIR